MGFVAPVAFSLFALAGVVIVLYILKVRRRPVTVPYLRLWDTLLAETRTRSLFKRLKRLFSLLLQLLILACIVLALTQPTFDLDSRKVEHIVVILDCSASMNAIEDPKANQTRFDIMAKKARELVDRRSHEDLMMLVAASDRIEVLSPFDQNTVKLRESLSRARPSHRSLDVNRVFSFIEEATRGKQNPVFLFLSDGSAGVLEARVREEPKAHIIAVGSPQENVGIVRFSARKNESLGTDFLLAQTKNFGSLPQEFHLELFLNGVRQKSLKRALEPGESRRDRFQLSLADGGTLRLAVDLQDVLPVDNEAFAIVEPLPERKIILVTASPEEAEPFTIAFGAMSEVVAPTSTAYTAAEFESLVMSDRQADLIICLNRMPRALPAQVPLILIHVPLPAFLPAEEVGQVARPAVWDWDREHILNRYLNYRDLPIPAARQIRIQQGHEIVQGYHGPLVSAFTLPQRKVVYVAFDMTSELFPFRLAFPMLLRNAIAWFGTEGSRLLKSNYAPGEIISPLKRVREDIVRATFFRGDQEQQAELAVLDGRFYFHGTDEPGPYAFDVGDQRHASVVNLFDPRESDLTPVKVEVDDEATAFQASFFYREAWVYLTLFGLLLWGLEWGLYHRRITE